jgi:hypothetical protein
LILNFYIYFWTFTSNDIKNFSIKHWRVNLGYSHWLTQTTESFSFKVSVDSWFTSQLLSITHGNRDQFFMILLDGWK